MAFTKPRWHAGFDEKYGEGSALKVLRTYEPPAEPEDPSMLEQFFDGAVDTLQGITGIISAPTELVETITNINTMGTEQANSIIDRSVTTRNNVLENGGKPPMSPEEAEFRERLEFS